MTISLRLNDEDTILVQKYAEIYGLTVSELFRDSVLQRIEDDLDLKAYDEAIKKYKENPITYSLDDVEKMLESDN